MGTALGGISRSGRAHNQAGLLKFTSQRANRSQVHSEGVGGWRPPVTRVRGSGGLPSLHGVTKLPLVEGITDFQPCPHWKLSQSCPGGGGGSEVRMVPQAVALHSQQCSAESCGGGGGSEGCPGLLRAVFGVMDGLWGGKWWLMRPGLRHFQAPLKNVAQVVKQNRSTFTQTHDFWTKFASFTAVHTFCRGHACHRDPGARVSADTPPHSTGCAQIHPVTLPGSAWIQVMCHLSGAEIFHSFCLPSSKMVSQINELK